jgi:hypothetical protein
MSFRSLPLGLFQFSELSIVSSHAFSETRFESSSEKGGTDFTGSKIESGAHWCCSEISGSSPSNLQIRSPRHDIPFLLTILESPPNPPALINPQPLSHAAGDRILVLKPPLFDLTLPFSLYLFFAPMVILSSKSPSMGDLCGVVHLLWRWDQRYVLL